VFPRPAYLAASSLRHLEESFVLLQRSRAAWSGASAATQSMDATTMGLRTMFGQRLEAEERLFEVATEATQVDHPLCSDCATEVHKEMEAQVQELQQDVAAYQVGTLPPSALHWNSNCFTLHSPLFPIDSNSEHVKKYCCMHAFSSNAILILLTRPL
jgi:hypothetical protein